MGSIKFFRNSICALAGATLSYWICILFGVGQRSGGVAVVLMAIMFLLVSSRMQAGVKNDSLKEFSTLLIISVILAVFTACLYSFNPDDSTFFHRIAFLSSSGNVFFPVYDTRIAFDQVAPISAAHLSTSWEYILSSVGGILGSYVAGYQIGGTILSVVIFVFSVNYTITHFFPDAKAPSKLVVTTLVMLCLFFDADSNRRIGAWLFIGGWTGKCFLSAVLIALFPAIDKAYESNSYSDWFFGFCLIVFFLGLTGSSLFVLPIAIGGLVLSQMVCYKSILIRRGMWILGLTPLLVGFAFIYKFGGLADDSYWRSMEGVSFIDYVGTCLSGRSILIYLALIPIILYGGLGFGRGVVIRFSIYQAILALILLNPLLHPIFIRFVPSDGFWRVYYLFQYPTVLVVAGMICIRFFQCGEYLKSLAPASLVLVFSVMGGSVLSLQSQWGYPHHFKRFLAGKLPEKELVSVKQSSKKCPIFDGGAVMLAPEEWETTAQMVYPSLISVAARHMQHNFSNTDPSRIQVPEAVRVGARNFVSGSPGGSVDDYQYFINRGVGVIVFRTPAENYAMLMLKGYTRSFSDNNYIVFCRNE